MQHLAAAQQVRENANRQRCFHFSVEEKTLTDRSVDSLNIGAVAIGLVAHSLRPSATGR